MQATTARIEELRRQLEGRDDVSAISPGVFRESRQADRVYFVEEVAGQQDVVANVFVSSSQLGKQGVMVAARGFHEFVGVLDVDRLAGSRLLAGAVEQDHDLAVDLGGREGTLRRSHPSLHILAPPSAAGLDGAFLVAD